MNFIICPILLTQCDRNLFHQLIYFWQEKKLGNKRMKKLHKMGYFFVSLLQSLII